MTTTCIAWIFWIVLSSSNTWVPLDGYATLVDCENHQERMRNRQDNNKEERTISACFPHTFDPRPR